MKTVAAGSAARDGSVQHAKQRSKKRISMGMSEIAGVHRFREIYKLIVANCRDTGTRKIEILRAKTSWPRNQNDQSFVVHDQLSASKGLFQGYR